MICNQCGNSLPEGSDLCTVCGKHVKNVFTVRLNTDPYVVVPEQSAAEDLSPFIPRIAEPEITPIVAEPVSDPVIEPVPESTANIAAQPKAWYLSPRVAFIIKLSSSIVFSILLLGFVLTTTALMILRPESASKVVRDADVTWLLEETDIGEIIVNELNASELISINMDVDTLDRFVRRENVSAQVGKMAEKYVKAISDADFDFYLDSEEILNFVKAITPDISAEFGINLTDTEYNAIANSIDRYVDLSEYSVGKIFSDTDIDAAVPYMLLSKYPLIVIGLLGVLVMFNTFLLHRKKIRYAFLCAGIPIVLSGVICFIAGLLIGPYSILFDKSGFYGIIKLIIGVSYLLFLPAFAYIAIGLISVIAFIVMSRMRTQYVLIDYRKKSKHFWLITGLIANISVFLVCSALSLLFFQNIPK